MKPQPPVMRTGLKVWEMVILIDTRGELRAFGVMQKTSKGYVATSTGHSIKALIM